MCIDPKSFWGFLANTPKCYGKLVYFQTFRHVVRSSRTDRLQNTNRTENFPTSLPS